MHNCGCTGSSGLTKGFITLSLYLLFYVLPLTTSIWNKGVAEALALCKISNSDLNLFEIKILVLFVSYLVPIK